MNLRRIAVIAQKETREIVRDRIYFSLAFLLPLILMFVFGYGMTQEVQNVPITIIDHDHSALSRDYAYRFIDSRYFDFKGYSTSTREAEALLQDGVVRAVIILPEKFQQRLYSGLPVDIQTLLDGTFTFRLRTIDGYIQAINQAVSTDLQMQYLAASAGISTARAANILIPIQVETRYLYNQELLEIWSVAPALIMFILTLSAPILMALSIVREKETGTIYNIYASTITRGEFLLGKLLPNIVISYINGIVLVMLATWYFGAPLKGNALFLAGTMFIYVIWASSLGLMISALVNTQIAAIMITVVLAMILVLQFSGMLIPVSSMTGLNYVLAQGMPPRYFNDAVTYTFLKSGGLFSSWRELLALLLAMLIFLVLGYTVFHKRSKV